MMKIKKLGHCCFITEPKEGVRIMTDPGTFSITQNEETSISAVLITHEHYDHLHIDSLKKVLENNPDCIVITNTSVGKLLDEAGIKYIKIEEGQKYNLNGVDITGFGNTHAEIYKDFKLVQNTGYTIDALCYPGDSFNYPDSSVDVLALPIIGPWMKTREAIDYAKNINPRICFPVHDAIAQDFAKSVWFTPETILQESGIIFKKPELGKEEEF
ncbi:MAG: putative Zn-dependent hydrolase of beta-lactamase fold protein [Parcubacteria group bacterium GW2011_GWF1_40_6]|nr:MAG: putative Zn-dependent hydrolase of beta-lactamase fold protein [Candidatus Nomurabacteria bacterium GW2011_GWF2_40_12]KKR67138.1 MAG: putative Zn-dependent hydrolase of beta-lactamase fold protein [Parcubacteria group bacterium GW2011_GWF1_40_6]